MCMLCLPKSRHVCTTMTGVTMSSDRIQTMTLTLWRRQLSMQETCSKSCQNNILIQHGPSTQLGIHWEDLWQMQSRFTLMMILKGKTMCEYTPQHIAHTSSQHICTQSYQGSCSCVPTIPNAHLQHTEVCCSTLHMATCTCALITSSFSAISCYSVQVQSDCGPSCDT